MPTSNRKNTLIRTARTATPVATPDATSVIDDTSADEPLLQARPVTNSTPLGEIHSATRRLAGNAPVEKNAPEPEPEPDYDDYDQVCVTVNFGSPDEISQGFWIGETQFDEHRVARNVPYIEARAMQRLYAPRNAKNGPGPVKIHPNDATLAEIAKRCGVRPSRDPSKLAAELLATIDQEGEAFLEQFTPAQLRTLAIRIGNKAAERKP